MTRLRVPRRLGVVEGTAADGAVLYVANLPDGPIVVLRDTALTIWQEATAPSSDQDLADRVAEIYGVAVSDVRGAVDACVDNLVARGVLEPVSGA